MPDTLFLIAVRSDRDDLGLPAQGIVAALQRPDAPNAHVTAIPIEEVTVNDLDRCRALFGRDNPDAFQTLADRSPVGEA